MGVNNSLNFPNLTAKAAPVLDDIVLLSDSAASSALKQSTIEKVPELPIGITIINPTGRYIAAMPGYYSNTSSNSVTQGLTLNTNIYFVPFCFNEAVTTAFIGTYVITGVAGATANLGIYDSAGGAPIISFPNNLLGVVNLPNLTSSNVTVNGALSVNLKPKTMYWAAIQTSTVTTLSLQAVRMNVACNASIGVSVGVGANVQNIIYPNSYSAGSMPATISSGSLVGSGQYAPLIVLS